MMRPEDIQNHDFLVGLRGYDKDEVRAFLTEVAAEHERLLTALEQGQGQAVAPAAEAGGGEDDFESIGAGVAAILRTAKEQAGQITGDAQARAAAMRDEAESIRREAKESAKELRDRITGEAEQLRQQAQQHVDDAKAEAERIVREATERVRQIEVEHDARMNNKAEEIARREAATRQRLVEAADELQLALVALNDDGKPAETNHEGEQQPALG